MEIILAVATIIGGVAAVWFFWDKITGLFDPPQVNVRELSTFIAEGQGLRERADEDPLPIQDHIDWVNRMNDYFKIHKSMGYEIRLSDFSGIPFLSDGTASSKFTKSIDGRIRRLHEFLSEL